MAGSKKSYIFRSACGIHSHDVKITHTHTQKGWIPLISNQRGTLESHFLRACPGFTRACPVHYRVSECLGLWQRERRREHLIGTIKHHHCHIDPVLSTGWLVRATGSLHQSEARGLRRGHRRPGKKTQSNVFISVCQVNRLQLLAADVHGELSFFFLSFIYPLKVKW